MKLLALVLFAFQGQLPTGDIATWHVDSPEVQIGQPIEATLHVLHSAQATPTSPQLALDYGWEVIDGPDASPIEGGTRLTWTVLALEPGERELPATEVALADGSLVLSGSKGITVIGTLAPEEDAPRPLPGFRTVTERTSSTRPRHLGLAALALGVLGLTTLLAWRRSRRPRLEDTPTELERFVGLDRTEARPLAIELADLVRSAAERRSGCDSRHGLTDQEWIVSLEEDGHLDQATRGEMGEVLAVCRDIKFAGLAPTRFAIDELFQRAEGLLRHLEDGVREEAVT